MGKSKDLATGASYVDTAGDTITGDTVVATTTQVPLRIENTAANSLGAYLKIRDGNSTSSQHTWIGRSTNDTYIYSNNSDLGMKITNAGQVTKPNQPSFHAYMSQSNPNITSNPTKIPYSATRWNVGSNFDTTNSRFVAPITGKYCFQVNHNVYGISDDQYFRTRVFVNGSGYMILGYMRARGSGDHTTNDSFLLDMSANDYVEIYTDSNDGDYYLSASDDWNGFSGFLVG